MKILKISCFVLFIKLLVVSNGISQENKSLNRISENLYNICFDFGLRPNNLVYAGSDGILIIDTGHEDKAIDLKNAAESINNEKMKYIINSHIHHDHVGGNTICSENAIIIDYSKFNDLLKSEIIKPAKNVFTGKNGDKYEYFILIFNKKEVWLIPQPGVHNDTDILTYIPDKNIVHTGDLYLSQSFPAIDRIDDYLNILNRMINIFPENTIFVPGHGKISNFKDLVDYRKMLLTTITVVKEKMKTISSMDELIKQKPLLKWEPWGEYLTFLNIDRWTEVIYQNYKTH